MATINASLYHLPRDISGRHPQSLDANLAVTIRPVKYIGKSAGGNVVLVDVE